MSDTITIFAPSMDLIPLEELLELAAHENITPQNNSEGVTVGYTVVWDDVTLQITQLTDTEIREDHVNVFQSATDDLLGGRTDKKARKIWRRVERMVNAIECTVTPDWDEARKAQLIVQGVMAFYDYALMFAAGTVYNENGNTEVGSEDSKRKYWMEEEVVEVETGEALARKKRSITQLKAERVPYIAHLPVIMDTSLAALRSVADVAQRAMALNLISRRADGKSLEWYQQKVTQYQLEEVVTSDEWEFAENDEPDEYLVLKFSRRMESYWLFLWALGFVKQLSRPDNFCDEKRANDILDTRSSEQFLLDADLRDLDTILDVADLHYRYHWAVIDAELYGKNPPRGLQQEAVYERHYALNWLLNYQDQAWDEVTTDT